MRPQVPPDERVVLERVRASRRARRAARTPRSDANAGGRPLRGNASKTFDARRGEAACRGRARTASSPTSASSSGSQVRSAFATAIAWCGALEADVHVQPEDQLALGDPLQRLDELGVARLVGDVLVLVARERVRARPRRSARRPRAAASRELRAQAARLLDRLGDGRCTCGRDLDRRLQQLGLDPVVVAAPPRRRPRRSATSSS